MLTAPIIYIQGSGGNLVARSLTLDPTTVPCLPKDLLHTALDKHYTTDQRFKMYNNWNHKDWSKSEQLFIKYHCPPGDTSVVQATTLKLISTFHPKQFQDGERYGTWGSDPYWDSIIFIDYEEEDVPMITKLAGLKRLDMPGHEAQVYNVELSCIQKLMADKPSHLSIHWRQLRTLEDFCAGIESLAEKLDVNFYPDFVKELWQCWDKQNKLLMHDSY